jgi:hypothetical protein
VLLRVFRGAPGSDEWLPLLDFVSPSFFAVVPLGELVGEGRALLRRAADAETRARVGREVGAVLGPRVLLGTSDAAADEADPPATPRERGQRVLEVYFAQLLHAREAFLDLRAGAFRSAAGPLPWQPGPWSVGWDPDFLASLRSVYRGFYGDDADTFERGLRGLGLEASRDVFLDHFGDARGGEVAFEMRRFVESFHSVFVRCRDEGVRLHRNFLPLGIALAGLHEHLAGLGGRFDPQEAFRRALEREGSA